MTPHSDQNNPYLEQEVLSASPLRLRWMLIRRAEELCVEVQRLWLAGDVQQANGWLIRIREIFGELLDGVQDNENPVSKSVSDFYVYLLQLLTQLDVSRDVSKLKTLTELLHVENETWEAVVKQFSGNEQLGAEHRSSSGERLEARNYGSPSPETPFLRDTSPMQGAPHIRTGSADDSTLGDSVEFRLLKSVDELLETTEGLNLEA